MQDISNFYLVLIFLVLLIPILPNLFAIWHAFKSSFPNPNEKLIWIFLAIFIPVLGGIIYLFWGRKRGQKMI